METAWCALVAFAGTRLELEVQLMCVPERCSSRYCCLQMRDCGGDAIVMKSMIPWVLFAEMDSEKLVAGIVHTDGASRDEGDRCLLVRNGGELREISGASWASANVGGPIRRDEEPRR